MDSSSGSGPGASAQISRPLRDFRPLSIPAHRQRKLRPLGSIRSHPLESRPCRRPVLCLVPHRRRLSTPPLEPRLPSCGWPPARRTENKFKTPVRPTVRCRCRPAPAGAAPPLRFRLSCPATHLNFSSSSSSSSASSSSAATWRPKATRSTKQPTQPTNKPTNRPTAPSDGPTACDRRQRPARGNRAAAIYTAPSLAPSRSAQKQRQQQQQH